MTETYPSTHVEKNYATCQCSYYRATLDDFDSRWERNHYRFCEVHGDPPPSRRKSR